MLLTHLNTTPFSKFILIDDCIEEPAAQVLNYLITCRLQLTYEVHYAIYEGCYSRKLIPKVICHDFTRNLNNTDSLTIENTVTKMNNPCVLFIDSLVHIILIYGFKEAYRILHDIISNPNILQVITLYHSDLLEDEKILINFQHLSTFFISLEPQFKSNKPRIAYTYKKSGGKVVKQIEEFYFENGVLKTEAIKKIDVQKLLQDTVEEIEPDKLTTFKISLKDDEEKAKASVVLPYLPKTKSEESEGTIYYQFDEVDDWDEEDPDDDLNI